MRNLKRTLSLALAALMLMSMMVVSAGAATKDFTDSSEIQNKEAVEVMVALNVISGKDDGSYFAPNDTLTREEMAKVVSYVMNGGVEPVVGTKVNPTYSDIKGIWSEKYIEYCTSMGIINGDGAGKFNPTGTLTAEQAAKMFLTAMGYNAEVFGFVGNDWAINVGRYANEAGLYEDLGDITPSQPISRDDASQMAYNAIQAFMMERDWTQDQTTGQITEGYKLSSTDTLLNQKFNGHVYEGVLVATGEYDLSAIIGTNGGEASQDGFVVNVDRYDNKTATGINAGDTYFEYKDQDLTNLMGQYVKVLYNSKTEVVYGIYPQAEKNLVLETAASLTDYTGLTNKVKVDGTTYNMESDIVYIYGEAVGSKAQTSDLQRADKVVYVDNDGNNKFDLAIVTPVDVAKVTFLNATNITFAPVLNNATQNGNAQLVENVVLSDGLAQNDYVVLTPSYYADADTLTKVDVASGTVSGVRNPVTPGSAPYNDYQLDGAWYKVAVSGGSIANSAIKSGSVVDYVAVNNVLFYAKLTSGATLSDVAVIYSMAYDDSDVFGSTSVKAKVMFSDGSTKEVTVDALYNAYNDTTNKVDLSTLDGTNNMDTEKTYIGKLASYKINNDGNYEFYLLSNSTNNKAGFDSVIDTTGGVPVSKPNSELTINGTLVADDAIIVVRNAAAGTNSVDGKITYVTGGDFKNMATSRFDTTDGAYALIGKDADGFSRVMFAIVQTTNGTGTGDGYNTTDKKFTLGTVSGSNFGYMTKDSWTETIDGDNYNCFEIWDGANVITVKAKDTATQYSARSIISYDEVGDGIVKNVTVNGTGFGEGSITAFTSSNVEIDGVTYKLTQDTVILNVDDTLKTGVAGSALLNATEIGDTGSFVKNARYIVANGEVKIIVVDINNDLVSASGDVSVSGTGLTSATLNELLAAVNSVEVSGAFTLNGNVTIPAGKTLSIDGNVTASTHKFVGGGTINVDGTVDKTEALTTLVVLGSGATQNITLPAAGVKIGTISGNVGAGSGLAYGGSDLTGKTLYQFDFTALGFQDGTSKVKVDVGNTGSASEISVANATDLASRFISGQTNVITVDIAGDSTYEITITVTAP